MNRFIQTHYDNGQSPNYYDYMNHPLLPLLIALESLLSNIDQLYTRIKLSEELCRNSSTHNLTKDESAAIYLYTDEHVKQSLHNELNKALRSKNQTMMGPWFGYLKLFNTGLEKLPTVKGKVWRGISINIADNLKENQDIIWGCFSSCSSSIHVIKPYLDNKAMLCSIETISGKNIRGYTRCIKDDEVLLLPGIHLRVKKIGYDSSIRQRVIQLVEIADENRNQSASIHNPISSTNKSVENASDRDEVQRNIESSIITFSNDNRYEVTYKKGKKQGYRKLYTVNGEIYEDRSADAKASGDGVRICSNGDRYEGDFMNGKMHGYGSLSCANGYTYMGCWIADKPYGNGISTWPNGNHYEGFHESGKIHHCGTYCSVKGDKYEGNFIDGKAHGKGLRIWADGDQYEGEFKDDKKHGYGTYTYASGGKYKGHWANDEMNGMGTLEWPSGSYYEGSFKNGKRHGIGKLTFVNGRVQYGTWENDKFIG
ncbi:unnamed protein product [Rotaria sp. Silwood1]|nr:unnamed protein product [Rotaria sp. Silwood1]